MSKITWTVVVIASSVLSRQLSGVEIVEQPTAEWFTQTPQIAVSEVRDEVPADGESPRVGQRDTFWLQPGFQIELLYTVPKQTQGSWVNMTFDQQGRIIASSEEGKGIYRIIPPKIGRQEETPQLSPALSSGFWPFGSCMIAASGGRRGVCRTIGEKICYCLASGMPGDTHGENLHPAAGCVESILTGSTGKSSALAIGMPSTWHLTLMTSYLPTMRIWNGIWATLGIGRHGSIMLPAGVNLVGAVERENGQPIMSIVSRR